MLFMVKRMSCTELIILAPGNLWLTPKRLNVVRSHDTYIKDPFVPALRHRREHRNFPPWVFPPVHCSLSTRIVCNLGVKSV